MLANVQLLKREAKKQCLLLKRKRSDTFEKKKNAFGQLFSRSEFSLLEHKEANAIWLSYSTNAANVGRGVGQAFKCEKKINGIQGATKKARELKFKVQSSSDRSIYILPFDWQLWGGLIVNMYAFLIA